MPNNATSKTPPGLLAVQDLIERHPSERAVIVESELRHRNRERLLFRGTRRALHIHVWTSVKAVLGLGASVFLFVWTVGELAQLSRWLHSLQQTSVKIPVPFSPDFVWNIGHYLPTSTAMELASKLPLLDWRDAAMIAIVSMVLLLGEKLIVAYFTWRHAAELREGEREVEEEIRVLNEWAGQGRVAGQKKDAPS